MNTIFKTTILFIVSVVSIYSFSLTGDKGNEKITGIWLGKLAVSGIELRIVFRIHEDNGILKAVMESPDQGANNISVDTVVFTNDTLRLEVPSVRGFYEGRVDEAFTSVKGKWYQNGAAFDLQLTKTDKLNLTESNDEPKPPFPYNSEDVAYKNKENKITLAGTFTFPKKAGPFPTVLLIPGSGKQNRDEELLGHKPFLVLADYLTRRGVAVLRVDDRGVGGSTGSFTGATTADFAGDVLAGVEYLKTRKEVNKKEIGLIGHSEGGLIAPMVAAKTKDVAFIVLMAGPGVSGDTILYMQTKLIEKAVGSSEEEAERVANINYKMYQVVKNGKDSSETVEKLRGLFDRFYSGLSKARKEQIGNPDIQFIRVEKTLMNPWFKFFLKYNPEPVLEKVKCPVLAINGTKDLQVPYKENLTAIKMALKKGGNKNFEIKELPGLNHLFQTATTGSPLEYARIKETIAPEALKTIGDWILKTAEKKK